MRKIAKFIILITFILTSNCTSLQNKNEKVQWGAEQKNLLLTQEYLKAKELIGKKIWRIYSYPCYNMCQTMISKTKETIYEAPVNKPLLVKGVDITKYGHAYHSTYGFHLVVINSKNEIGLFPYEPNKFTTENLKIKYIKLYGKYFTNLILERKISFKMTPSMVLASWGKPDKINKYVSKYSDTQQWVYGQAYVYFKNGKLTSWQEFN